jgi:PAS domain S-box-containing protein
MLRLADDIVSISAAIVEASPDAIITADLDGRIMSWNGAAERITGLSAAEIIGKDLGPLIPDGSRDNADRMLALARAGETI